jgi:hypothetical protein
VSLTVAHQPRGKHHVAVCDSIARNLPCTILSSSVWRSSNDQPVDGSPGRGLQDLPSLLSNPGAIPPKRGEYIVGDCIWCCIHSMDTILPSFQEVQDRPQNTVPLVDFWREPLRSPQHGIVDNRVSSAAAAIPRAALRRRDSTAVQKERFATSASCRASTVPASVSICQQ